MRKNIGWIVLAGIALAAILYLLFRRGSLPGFAPKTNSTSLSGLLNLGGSVVKGIGGLFSSSTGGASSGSTGGTIFRDTNNNGIGVADTGHSFQIDGGGDLSASDLAAAESLNEDLSVE